MKKFLVLCSSAMGVAAAVLTLSSAVATADDSVVGETYKDAKSALSQKGLTAVVASTVGDRKDWDACIVTSATKAPEINGYGSQATKKMNVNLNCYATNGSATGPGFSISSPQGQKQHELDVAQKEREEAAAAATAQPDAG